MSDVNGSIPDRQIQQSKGAQTVAQAGSTPRKGSIGVIGATTIGVGGMMGAGIYTLVGLAATTTGVWLPVAFLVGGFVSAFSVYSYARLGIRFPSRGGAAQFLVQGFGDGIVAGRLEHLPIPWLRYRPDLDDQTLPRHQQSCGSQNGRYEPCHYDFLSCGWSTHRKTQAWRLASFT